MAYTQGITAFFVANNQRLARFSARSVARGVSEQMKKNLENST